MKMVSYKKALIYIIIVCIFSLTTGIIVGQNFVHKKIISGLQFLPVPKTIDPDIDYSLFIKVWSVLKDKYVSQPVSDKDLFYGSLKGLTAGLEDPYSVFLDPELANKFLEDMSGSFEGIGIEIGIKDNRLTVIAPLPNTPAFRAGLRAGDKIYKIDNKDTINMSLDEVVHLIRGPKGTPVILTIWHNNESKARDVQIIRDVIEIESVSWELVQDKIAYLNIAHFSEDTWGNFKDIAREVLMANPSALILDLRNNPGGYLDTAVNISGYWLAQEIITVSKDAKGYETEYKTGGKNQFKHLPTVVLANKGSASASEILAGALQDYNQATILGEQTFGKGSVQSLETFSDGSALKLTIAYWYTPLGRSISEHGIVPDIVVEFTEQDYELEKDPQLEKAIEILSK